MNPSPTGYLEQMWDYWNEAQRFVGFWTPTLDLPPMLNPGATIGALLTLIVTTGVAIGAIGVFVLSALVLYLLLTQVFGLRLEFALP